jgi:hypothetical protein
MGKRCFPRRSELFIQRCPSAETLRVYRSHQQIE